MKKILMVILAVVLCFSLVACGGDDKAKDGGSDADKEVTEEKEDDGIDPNATVTKEKYDELQNGKWYDLTPEDMEKFLGVKYVVDDESTEVWGEGYLVVNFPGPDEDSYVHVLFKEDKDGTLYPSSLSAIGQLIE